MANILLPYMILYGIDNVRGGIYSDVVLSDETIINLKNELQIKGGCSKCLKCKCNEYVIDKINAKKYCNYICCFNTKDEIMNEIEQIHITMQHLKSFNNQYKYPNINGKQIEINDQLFDCNNVYDDNISVFIDKLYCEIYKEKNIIVNSFVADILVEIIIIIIFITNRGLTVITQ